jgi:hypothetical protein
VATVALIFRGTKILGSAFESTGSNPESGMKSVDIYGPE